MKSNFKILKMDCPSEEQLIRMRLRDFPGIRELSFDLPARRLSVSHASDPEKLKAEIDRLNLDATLESNETEDAPPGEGSRRGDIDQRKTLLAAFWINALLFLGEFVAGLLSNSMGLVGDSLDMFADATVYGMGLAAVGGTIARKRGIARACGYLQLALAVLGVVEVVRRFIQGEGMPGFQSMVVVSLVALAGNVTTLLILSRKDRREPHMKAVWICTSNDVLVNLMVTVSGVLVWMTHSGIPDLVAGGIIFIIVALSARKILAL